MFKELAEIAKTTALSLIISSSGENELQVMVIPKAKEGMNPALSQPLNLTATPEELGEKFASLLLGYNTARKTLEETLEDAKLFMSAAGKSAQEKATAAAKKPTATVPEKPENLPDEESADDDLFS